ncbi:MAG: hypothetical protein ACRDYC_06290, partial [Acidimicrobiales bacterium]
MTRSGFGVFVLAWLLGISVASGSASAQPVTSAASQVPPPPPLLPSPAGTFQPGPGLVRIADTRDGSGEPLAGQHLAFGSSLTVPLPGLPIYSSTA